MTFFALLCWWSNKEQKEQSRPRAAAEAPRERRFSTCGAEDYFAYTYPKKRPVDRELRKGVHLAALNKEQDDVRQSMNLKSWQQRSGMFGHYWASGSLRRGEGTKEENHRLREVGRRPILGRGEEPIGLELSQASGYFLIKSLSEGSRCDASGNMLCSTGKVPFRVPM